MASGKTLLTLRHQLSRNKEEFRILMPKLPIWKADFEIYEVIETSARKEGKDTRGPSMMLREELMTATRG